MQANAREKVLENTRNNNDGQVMRNTGKKVQKSEPRGRWETASIHRGDDLSQALDRSGIGFRARGKNGTVSADDSATRMSDHLEILATLLRYGRTMNRARVMYAVEVVSSLLMEDEPHVASTKPTVAIVAVEVPC